MSTSHIAIAISSIALAVSAASAQSSPDTRRAELLRQRAAIDTELRSLDAVPTPTQRSQAPLRQVATTDRFADNADIIVTGKALSLTTKVTGQTVTTIDNKAFRNTPATTIADIVKLSPGVAVIAGNGPRDVGVSIRRSKAHV